VDIGRKKIVTKPLHLLRQTTIYTCGAACLAAVSRLQGGTLDEMTLARDMNAKPVIGIENETLWNTAKNMGAENCGENIWDFQKCAVLNILNPISGVGHYVVALRTNEKGDVIALLPILRQHPAPDAEMARRSLGQWKRPLPEMGYRFPVHRSP